MKISRLLHLLQHTVLDAHVLTTLLFRGWSIISGAVVVICIPYWLNKTEQGFYYAFSSLVALQIFFELGLSFVVTQMVSHEMAHVALQEDGSLSGNPANLDRLHSILRLLKKWYLCAALGFFIIVSIIGLFFLKTEAGLAASDWMAPWVLLVLFTSANLYLSPFLAMYEGCGLVSKVAGLRLAGSICGSLLLWLLLTLGAKLWAVPVLAASGMGITAYYLAVHGKLLHALDRHRPQQTGNSISWRRDVFPFQWRIALSWISGYFIFHLFTPIIFANQGAVAAGQFGMTLAIFNSLLTLGMSWINAKTPVFSQHIAKGERQQLNTTFLLVAKRSVLFTATACCSFLLVAYWVGLYHPALTDRLASVPVMICIALVTITNNVIFAAAAYMRSHKEEPMLVLSLVVGLATLTAIYFGSRHSILLTMALYATVTLGLALPWTILLFLRYFKQKS